MSVREGVGRRRFLRWGERGDRGKLKMDVDGQLSGEQWPRAASDEVGRDFSE